MSRFLNSRFKNVEEYVPGEQPQNLNEYIKLNTNESPFPPSPGVIAAINGSEAEKLRLYCDPDCKELVSKMAKLYGLGTENIFLANGSDDILNFIFMIFCDRGAIYPEISYGFYKVYAELHGINDKKVPLKEGLMLDPEDYCEAGKTVIIANPNAPTGRAISLEEIEKILRSNPDDLVVIDEAYVDFGGESAVGLVKKYDNLLVVQTFSKSRSMAGARLGFAVASAPIIADLTKIKYSTNPYNINRLTQAAACAAIDEDEYYKKNAETIIANREYTTAELKKLGFEVLPSKANFVFAKSEKIDGEELYKELKDKKILIRHFTIPAISQYNRITIGTREQMDEFLKAIREILKRRS